MVKSLRRGLLALQRQRRLPRKSCLPARATLPAPWHGSAVADPAGPIISDSRLQ